MINTDVVVEDCQLVSLILDFLSFRNFHSTMRSLEKESGVVNCTFSENILFLRGLVLDGEWEAILTFSRPFEGIEDFDSKQFRYLVLKQKFMEVLYFKSGFGGGSTSYSIEDLIKCLNQLEQDCPSKTEYSKLCWLLTVPDLPEQPEYRDWNPTTARIKCFEQILELFSRVVPKEKKSSNEECYPTKDRLLNLVIKGLCFESCVEYCHLRAINGSLSEDLYFHITGNILTGPTLESCGNFLSWLRNLSQDAFVTPFEPLTLEVDLKQMKQVKSAMFSKSSKRDDAEILSRSLSLSGRLAVSDIASHLCSLETERKSAGNPSTQLHTATPSLVSKSHHEFLYKGTPAKVRSSLISNGFGNGNNRELESEYKDVLKKCVSFDNLNKAVDDQIHSSPHIVDGVYSTDQRSSPLPVHMLKEEQQQYVLRQLEHHEKQKLELHEKLTGHLSSDASSQKAYRGDTVIADKYPGTRGSMQNLENQHLTHDGQLQRSKVFSHDVPLSDTTKQPDEFKELKQDFPHLDQENLNPVQMVSDVSQHHHSIPDSQHYGQRNGQHNVNSFVVNKDMASTPVAQTKHKLEKLNICKDVEDNIALQTIPVTPAEQTFPLTPAANGGVGHWVALSDGSGILNTSTPKAKKQVMSSTPAPPASPVLSVDGGTPSGLPLGYGESISNKVAHYSTEGEYPQPNSGVDSTKDKEHPAAFIQQAPIKHGPKVNGVRRALAPQSGVKQRPGANEDTRGTITPTQAPSGNAKVKSSAVGTKSPSLFRAHVHTQYSSQEFRETSQEKVDLKGAQVKNGATFVVDEGASENHPLPRRVVEGEIQHEGTISVHKDSTREGAKGKLLPRNAETANMTYRKPSNTTPPNDTTVTINHGNRMPLLDKQKNMLHSSSDIKFFTVATLEDVQAVRAVAFHPSGDLFAIGSNSKTLRVCSSEGLNSLQRLERKATGQPPQPTILFKSNRHHRGSIYCIAWSPAGDIIATGSNDKSIKLTRFDADTCTPTWPGMELAIHSATIRDLAFVSRTSGTPVLISGGAGDGYILISDCGSGQTVGQLKGHSAHIMTVYAASDEIIASGSADNTVRLWDLRSQRCIDAIATGDSCVASVCVNPAGNMLASGHEDGSCMIYDITAGRTLELFKPHTMDCRSVRFSPDNNFLLTGSYDTSIIMMDVRKDLETRMPSYSVVARHSDKVIQCRWHPHLPAFLSSSADKTASLWALDY